VARGRVRQYYENVDGGSPANSRLKIVLLEATGLEADATLRDYDDLAALLAGSSNEQTNQARKTITAANLSAAAADDTNDRLDLDFPDQVYTALGGNAIGKLLVVYCPDGVTPGADSTFIPLTAHSFDVSPSSADVTAQVSASGFYRSA
jgi:hypothetical protein